MLAWMIGYQRGLHAWAHDHCSSLALEIGWGPKLGTMRTADLVFLCTAHYSTSTRSFNLHSTMMDRYKK